MKNVVVAIALVFGAVAMARAQSSVNTTVYVNVYLAEQTLAWSTSTVTLDFGSSTSPLVLPVTPTIDATSSPSAQAISITGSAGAPVTFTYNATTSLTNAATSTSITYTAQVVGDSTNAQGNATTLPAAGGTNFSLSSSHGAFYIWIGGSLGSLPATTKPGTYSGSYTITAAYGV